MNAANHNDIVIIGGGPIGSVLALALEGSGKRVCLLEARSAPAPSDDPRTLALSYSSRLVLERIGVWPELAVTPIRTIHISQQNRFGRAELDASRENLPALGYVVRYGALMQALQRRLAASALMQSYDSKVETLDVTPSYAAIGYWHAGQSLLITAQLAAIADGAGSLLKLSGSRRRCRDYAQHAIVAEVATSRGHANIAYERFTPAGPAALLPIEQRYALVWTVAPDQVEDILALPDAAFLARLQAHFGERAGRFVAVGKRNAFPLQLTYAERVTSARTVLIGNAAQSLHPVAGQGINLGMRDAWALAQRIQQRGDGDIGTAGFLDAYRRRRLLDSTGGIFFTDALVRLFSNEVAGLAATRGVALAAFDMLDPLKRFVVRRMTLGASRTS